MTATSNHFDEKTLSGRFDNDEKILSYFYQEILLALKEHAEFFLNPEMVSSCTLHEIDSMTHKLKGLALNSCFIQLTKDSKEFEDIIRVEQRVDIPLLQKIQRELTYLLEVFETKTTT